MNEDHRKHLEFIQAVIARMANNTFLIRGWSVALISALFALAAKDSNKSFVAVSYFPCVMFWFLDGYYLSQERKFRSKYNSIRSSPKNDFDMDPGISGNKKDSWIRSLLSPTAIIFHGTILAGISIALFYIK